MEYPHEFNPFNEGYENEDSLLAIRGQHIRKVWAETSPVYASYAVSATTPGFARAPQIAAGIHSRCQYQEYHEQQDS